MGDARVNWKGRRQDSVWGPLRPAVYRTQDPLQTVRGYGKSPQCVHREGESNGSGVKSVEENVQQSWREIGGLRARYTV